MLKFIKSHMATITDIEIFPLISFVLFFSIFVLVLIQVFFFLKKQEINEIAALPMEDDADNI